MEQLTNEDKALLFDLHVRGTISINRGEDFDSDENYCGFSVPESFEEEYNVFDAENALDREKDEIVTIDSASVTEVTPFLKAPYRSFYTKPGIDEFDIKRLVEHQREQYGRGSLARRLKKNLAEAISCVSADGVDAPELGYSCLKKTTVTPMPEWLERQLDNAERTVASWSDGKCEAAGIPRKTGRPWVPNDGERYYVWLSASQVTHSMIWHGLNSDYGWLGVGNCHKTREEAEAWGKIH